MWSSSIKGSSDKVDRTSTRPKSMCIVVEKPDLNSNPIRCSDAAAQFIHDQLSGDWSKGGGGLVVQRQLPT